MSSLLVILALEGCRNASRSRGRYTEPRERLEKGSLQDGRDSVSPDDSLLCHLVVNREAYLQETACQSFTRGDILLLLEIIGRTQL